MEDRSEPATRKLPELLGLLFWTFAYLLALSAPDQEALWRPRCVLGGLAPSAAPPSASCHRKEGGPVQSSLASFPFETTLPISGKGDGSLGLRTDSPDRLRPQAPFS